MSELEDRALLQRINAMEAGGIDADLEVDENGLTHIAPRRSAQMTLNSPEMNPYAIRELPGERESAAEFTGTIASGTAGAVGGAAAVTAGLPGDLVGVLQGIGSAIDAEEGERFASFLETMADVSNRIGSGATLEVLEDRIDQLPISDELKEDMRAGSKYIGEWADLPVGLKAIASGVRRYVSGASERVAEREGGVALRSGIDPREPIDNAIVGAQRMMQRGEDALEEAPTPAVQARIAAEPIEVPTGQRIKNEDVGQFLVNQSIERHGRKLDPISNPNDLNTIIEEGAAEAAYQLSQPVSGVNWYNEDVAQAFEQTSQVIPQLAEDEGLRVVMTAMAAATSPGTRAAQNWKNAAAVMEEWLETGQISGRNPANGKFFGGTRGPIIEKQLQLLEYLLNTKGVQGTADFLLSEHTVADLTALRQESGLYAAGNKVPGKAADNKLGAFLFGEKVGPFMLNLNGLQESTVDVWNARSYNRLTGQLFDTPDNQMVGGPRNETERDIIKQWNRGIGQQLGLDEQDAQAVMWYFEQQLYYGLGVKSARSEAFSDGARSFLNDRGITESVRGSDAPEARAEPQGATGAGQEPVRSETIETGSPDPEMGGDL